MASPASSVLSPSQLELMARNGEERTAEAGDVLFRVGDRTYPFIVILDGEIAIQNPTGREIIRHGRNVFLGEMNLLSGQTVFLTATATRPTRYLAVERDVIRNLMFEDSALSDLLMSTFMRRREALQQEEGIGIEVFGPHSSPDTRRIVDFARRNRLPHAWRDPEAGDDPNARAVIDSVEPAQIPVLRLLVEPTSTTRAGARSPAPSESVWSWASARRWTCW
jgi:thioredoxin reductase (NADPH)